MLAPTGATEEDCHKYLQGLGLSARLHQAGKLLFKPLSRDIVIGGLKRLNSESILGIDGFSAKFFKRFSAIFEPQMCNTMQRVIRVGCMPSSGTSAVVTMIPKTNAMQTLDMLRPIALQTTRQKWVTNILLILLKDVLQQCILQEQTGFLRNCSILNCLSHQGFS